MKTTKLNFDNGSNPCSLEVRDLSFAPHKRAEPLIHSMSFHVPAGTVMGVVGANGAGKSTLLRLLYRYHKPTTGEIRLDGSNLWDMAPRQSSLMVAAVLQEQPTNFAFTVREIVALGRTPHYQSFGASTRFDDQKVSAALERMDLTEMQDRNFSTLSGGERQRVMVARALAQEPQVLILDEPTNHLDIRQKLEIMKLIKDIGLTIIVSLHDLNSAIEICDQILLIENGEMKGFGAPQDVLNQDQVERAFQVRAQHEELSISKRNYLTFHLIEKEENHE